VLAACGVEDGADAGAEVAAPGLTWRCDGNHTFA
jgi:hypothetical protein